MRLPPCSYHFLNPSLAALATVRQTNPPTALKPGRTSRCSGAADGRAGTEPRPRIRPLLLPHQTVQHTGLDGDARARAAGSVAGA